MTLRIYNVVMGLQDNSFPPEKLPQCWQDDVRMNALFAPFRLKSANPESWDMKMKFWSDLVRQWCRHRRDPIVSAADIKCAFQRKGRTSACIDIVIEEMFRNGDLSPISKYQQILHNGPEGWVWWGAKLAFKPAAIALTAVSSLLPTRQALDDMGLPKASIESTQRFVLECAVKEQAMNFLNNFPAGVERIGTIEDLMLINKVTNRETFEIILGYLVSQGAAVKRGDVVKIAEPNKKATPVNEMDEALVKLMSAERKLEIDLARLSRDVITTDNDVRAALKLGNKLLAKNHLRRKHKAQTRVERCESALENVRHLLQQARDVDVNATVVDSYKTSAQAMKQTMKDGGLEEDLVHDTMDDLKEVMESYNEVEKALGGNLDDFDLADLEKELSELMSGPGGGGTPARSDTTVAGDMLPSPPKEHPERKVSDREFVFDGEEQMLAELNKLGFDDASPKEKVALTAEEFTSKQSKNTDSKPWNSPPSDSLKPTSWTRTLDSSIETLSKDYVELRQDERLHPGQTLKVDYSSPSRLYGAEFQVRDHKSDDHGVWLFNTDDRFAASTAYTSSESPGKLGSNFQMAPGGERKHPPRPKDEDHVEDHVEDLQRRLSNLRGFNL
ncbi:charged multivesicular body protein 7 isoform X1 [Leptidea sinapis]|uniref:charged multivesicular body protein 7 isoform X1 n=2 Tax=Leptidea sinapis TaxID=189913 RepID=UPI00213348DF|nr:charged multivesicular body protein 7 isoform X1 [Leptidea sinapis]